MYEEAEKAKERLIQRLIDDEIMIEQGLEFIEEIKNDMKTTPVEQWGANRHRNRDKYDDLVMEVGAFEASIQKEPVVPLELAILVASFVQDQYTLLIEPIIWLLSVGTDSYCKDLHLEAQSKILETEKVRIRGLDCEQLALHQDQLISRRISNSRAMAILEVLSGDTLEHKEQVPPAGKQGKAEEPESKVPKPKAKPKPKVDKKASRGKGGKGAKGKKKKT